MIPALSPKQADEVLPGRYYDFKKLFLDGETIESATVVSSVEGMVAADSVAFSGSVVTWTITGGTDGDVAIFTISAVGSLGSTREREVSIKVKDTP